MTYVLILFLTYVLHLMLKLSWIPTGIVLVFLLVMQHFHRKKHANFIEARKRFLDASLYIDTLLYSFLKEKKIMNKVTINAKGHQTYTTRLGGHD